MSETRSGPEPHLFISYASADLGSATAIVDKVIAAGYQIWFDRTGIPGGVSYGPEIVAAIKSCRALLLLCSGAAFASRNVRQEIHLAWKYARPTVRAPRRPRSAAPRHPTAPPACTRSTSR